LYFSILIKCFVFLSIRLRQVTREVDAPFVSRHGEYSDVYSELTGEKNASEQAFNTESKTANYLGKLI
jgi:hypothetical protein